MDPIAEKECTRDEREEEKKEILSPKFFEDHVAGHNGQVGTGVYNLPRLGDVDQSLRVQLPHCSCRN